MPPSATPTHLDLSRDKGLTVKWSDGSQSFYDVKYLRLMSPSAEQRELREQMERNPLTVLPASAANSGSEPLAAVRAELVGNYAVRIVFSDGHDTGIYSWDYLRRIERDTDTIPAPKSESSSSSHEELS